MSDDNIQLAKQIIAGIVLTFGIHIVIIILSATATIIEILVKRIKNGAIRKNSNIQ